MLCVLLIYEIYTFLERILTEDCIGVQPSRFRMTSFSQTETVKNTGLTACRTFYHGKESCVYCPTPYLLDGKRVHVNYARQEERPVGAPICTP